MLADRIGQRLVGDARAGRMLDRLELPGVTVVFHGRERIHRAGMAGHESKPPTGHVVAFAHRVQFNRDIHAAGTGENRGIVIAIHERGVGRVLHDDEVMLFRQRDERIVKCGCRRGPGGVVRIVDVKQLGLIERLRRNRGEVGQKSIFFFKLNIHHAAAEVFCVRGHHRITGHGLQHDVAGVHETERQHRQRRLGADAVVNVLVGVETGDAEKLAHVFRGGDLERLNAVVGVAAVGGIINRLLQRLADRHRGHLVGLADAEVEQLDIRPRGAGRRLGTFDFLKLVDFVRSSKGFATDAVGEERLKIHGR